jgi:hypothetical protein
MGIILIAHSQTIVTDIICLCEYCKLGCESDQKGRPCSRDQTAVLHDCQQCCIASLLGFDASKLTISQAKQHHTTQHSNITPNLIIMNTFNLILLLLIIGATIASPGGNMPMTPSHFTIVDKAYQTLDQRLEHNKRLVF